MQLLTIAIPKLEEMQRDGEDGRKKIVEITPVSYTHLDVYKRQVTLRGEKMYEFADRLINLALPRVRDFRGVNPNAFDGRGRCV